MTDDGALVDLTSQAIETLLFGLVVSVVLAGVVIGIIGILLFRAGRLPHPAPLVISISLMALVALMGGLITGNGDAFTIAATGAGALAGALSVSVRERNPRLDDPQDTPPD